MATESLPKVVNGPFDLWDESHRSDPKPVYREMRVTAPVFQGIGPQTGARFGFFPRGVRELAVTV